MRIGQHPAASPWPTRDDELRAHWASGLSSRQIGAAMKLTRNAVIGRAHRLKLPAREVPAAFKPARATTAAILEMQSNGMSKAEISRRTGIRRETLRERLRAHEKKVETATPAIPLAALVVPALAPIVQRVVAPPAPKPAPQPRLPSRGCLWPMWAAKGPQYWSAIASGRALECGAPLVSADAPYCRAHRAKGTTSPPRPTTVADRAWPVAHPGDGGRSVEMTTAAEQLA